MNAFKKFFVFVKNYINKNKNNKLGENLVIFIIVGIIIIIAGGTIFDGGKPEKKSENENQQNNDSILAQNMDIKSQEYGLKEELEKTLSQINGAGKVTVMITYVSGKEIVPYYDTKRSDNNTDEKDSAGGTRKQMQSDFESNIAFEGVGNSENRPIIVKEIFPEVKGVVVVSNGASDMIVKENLVNAVKVLMDVPVHKIQVFERKE